MPRPQWLLIFSLLPLAAMLLSATSRGYVCKNSMPGFARWRLGAGRNKSAIEFKGWLRPPIPVDYGSQILPPLDLARQPLRGSKLETFIWRRWRGARRFLVTATQLRGQDDACLHLFSLSPPTRGVGSSVVNISKPRPWSSEIRTSLLSEELAQVVHWARKSHHTASVFWSPESISIHGLDS